MKIKLALPIIALALAVLMSACGEKASSGTFKGVDDAKLPNILEKTVGTIGSVYYTSGIKDNGDYDAVFTAEFKKTTQEDYDALLLHYSQEATASETKGELLFDWGVMHISQENDTIFISANIYPGDYK